MSGQPSDPTTANTTGAKSATSSGPTSGAIAGAIMFCVLAILAMYNQHQRAKSNAEWNNRLQDAAQVLQEADSLRDQMPGITGLPDVMDLSSDVSLYKQLSNKRTDKDLNVLRDDTARARRAIRDWRDKYLHPIQPPQPVIPSDNPPVDNFFVRFNHPLYVVAPSGSLGSWRLSPNPPEQADNGSWCIRVPYGNGYDTLDNWDQNLTQCWDSNAVRRVAAELGITGRLDEISATPATAYYVPCP